MERLTLITCTFDRDEEFVRLIRSISTQDVQNIQLIVVDQNTPARAQNLIAELSPSFEVQVLELGRMGLSRARNTALEHADGTIIGFPDDDCWYPADFLARILEAFQKYAEYDFLACKTMDDCFRPSVGSFLKKSQDIRITNAFWAGNSNGIFLRKEALDCISGFDESLGVGADTPFGAGEETDMLLRLLSNGARGKFFADLFVHHPSVSEDTDLAVSRARRYAPGIGKLMARHQFPAWFVALRVLRPAMSAIYFAATLNFSRCRYKWVWSTGIAKGFFDKTA